MTDYKTLREEVMRKAFNAYSDSSKQYGKAIATLTSSLRQSPHIKNVYFNNPVTVVLWTDGTKTIVRCDNKDSYDPEKGLAMAISKKFLGSNSTKSNYYDEFKKWLPKEEKAEKTIIGDVINVEQDETGVYATVDIAKLGKDVLKGVYEALGAKSPSAVVPNIGRTADPVQKAYDILVKFRDSDDVYESFDLEEVIGYFGDALE